MTFSDQVMHLGMKILLTALQLREMNKQRRSFFMLFCMTSLLFCTNSNSLRLVEKKSEKLRKLYLLEMSRKLEKTKKERQKHRFDPLKSLALSAVTEIDLKEKFSIIQAYGMKFEALSECYFSYDDDWGRMVVLDFGVSNVGWNPEGLEYDAHVRDKSVIKIREESEFRMY